jgi:hypothetical protein
LRPIDFGQHPLDWSRGWGSARRPSILTLKPQYTLAISRKAVAFKSIFGGMKSTLKIRQHPPTSTSDPSLITDLRQRTAGAVGVKPYTNRLFFRSKGEGRCLIAPFETKISHARV